VGLDNAGKTSIMKTLSNENIKTVGPTKGFHVKNLIRDGMKITFWDLGGIMNEQSILNLFRSEIY